MSGSKDVENGEIYISADELSKGFDNLPKISLSTQKSLRRNKSITYTKIGKEVYYTKKWVLDYIEHNKIKSEIKE